MYDRYKNFLSPVSVMIFVLILAMEFTAAKCEGELYKASLSDGPG